MRTTELVALAQAKADLFNENIKGIRAEIEMEDDALFTSSRIAGIAIVEFFNILEEIYMRVIKKAIGKRVARINLMGYLECCNTNISEESVQHLIKMKYFRNHIAHSLSIETPVLKYFKKKEGRIEKVQNRIKVLLENLKDDVDYAYIYVEAS